MFNHTINRRAVLVLTLTSWLVTNTAWADSDGQGGKRRGPPPEAIEACENLTQGESCSFTGRRGDTIAGSCIVPRSDDGLACAPEGGPPSDHGRRGGAQESE